MPSPFQGLGLKVCATMHSWHFLSEQTKIKQNKKIIKVIVRILDTVTHTFNPNTEETEEGGFLGVGGHPGLHCKVLSQKRRNTSQTSV